MSVVVQYPITMSSFINYTFLSFFFFSLTTTINESRKNVFFVSKFLLFITIIVFDHKILYLTPEIGFLSKHFNFIPHNVNLMS